MSRQQLIGFISGLTYAIVILVTFVGGLYFGLTAPEEVRSLVVKDADVVVYECFPAEQAYTEYTYDSFPLGGYESWSVPFDGTLQEYLDSLPSEQ